MFSMSWYGELWKPFSRGVSSWLALLPAAKWDLSNLDVLVAMLDGVHRRHRAQTIYRSLAGFGIAKDVVVVVGAVGFEPTTPCAQGGFRLLAKVPYFQALIFQSDSVGLLEVVELFSSWMLLAALTC
jgi:hypothetical protein